MLWSPQELRESFSPVCGSESGASMHASSHPPGLPPPRSPVPVVWSRTDCLSGRECSGMTSRFNDFRAGVGLGGGFSGGKYKHQGESATNGTLPSRPGQVRLWMPAGCVSGGNSFRLQCWSAAWRAPETVAGRLWLSDRPLCAAPPCPTLSHPSSPVGALACSPGPDLLRFQCLRLL